MQNLILETMEPINSIDKTKVENYGKKFIAANVGDVLESFILTSKISLWIFHYPNSGCSAWAYYPKSGCQDYISGFLEENTPSSLDDWVSKCIDTLLHKHDWFDRDVMLLIENRGGKSAQRK